MLLAIDPILSKKTSEIEFPLPDMLYSLLYTGVMSPSVTMAVQRAQANDICAYIYLSDSSTDFLLA